MATRVQSGSVPPLLLSGVWKRFGNVVALRDVDFAVQAGTVHALLGENGAGKSTSMSIASGLLRPDAGSVSIRGEQRRLRTPRDAVELGIGMVHQDLRLVEDFTVAENVHLGWLQTPRIVSAQQMVERCTDLLERFGMQIDPGAQLWRLSMAERQQVAILRALSRGASVLILDEPTSLLAPPEAERLATVIRRIRDDGAAIVFISHKLPEVLALADTITVMRGGSVVASGDRSSFEGAQLAELMVGGEVGPSPEPARRPRGGPVLECRGLVVADDHGRSALDQLDLTLHAGEVLGVAGVSGNGQRELAEAMAGIRPAKRGAILINGKPVAAGGAGRFISAGVGFMPDDPGVGLPPALEVGTAVLMRASRRRPVRVGPWHSPRRGADFVRRLLESADLGDVDPRRRAATLSGGQAQRLIFRRELENGKLAIIAMHPSRGLDVAATGQVRRMLAEARDAGAGILLVSEDLNELLELSDRVQVLYAGKIAGALTRAEFDRGQIGKWMAGLERAA
jgi:simple sugar transport system ATP-binding protein